MKHRYPSEADCKRVGPRLERLGSLVIDYAHRKRYIDPFIADFKERIPDPSEFPQEWSEMVVAMLGIGAVMTAPKRAQGFVRSVQNDLAQPELALARQWRKVPWVYVVFEELEVVEHDILLVRPVGDPPPGWPGDVLWEELPVYSPSLSRAFDRGVSSGVALLLYDGMVFHTYGVVLLFAAIDVGDLLFFASVLADDSGEDELLYLLGAPEEVPSISGVIRNTPLPFLMLFNLQESPVMTGRRGPWRYCVSMAEYVGPEDLSDEAMWRRVVAESTGDDEVIQDFVAPGDAVGMRLGTEGPMYEPLILVSPEDGVVFVRAMNEAAYSQGVRAIRSLVVMPERPQVTASMVMMQAAHKILDPVDVASELEALVADALDAEMEGDVSDGGPVDDDVIPLEFEAVQPILDLLMQRYHEGADYTDDDIAARTGVAVEHVASMRKKVEGMFGGGGGGAGAADRFGLPPGPFRRLFAARVPAEPGVIALRDLRSVVLTDSERGMIREAPIIRFALWFLGKGKVPATSAGYVAPKVVRQAVAQGVVPSEEEAPMKELDVPVFYRYREVLEEAGCMQLDGRWFVPGYAIAPMGAAVDPGTLIWVVAEALFTTVRWDDSLYFGAVPRLRESAGFLLYVLRTMAADAPDGWVDDTALHEAFLGANPGLGESILVSTGITVNFIAFFAETLGIVQTEEVGGANVRVRPTPLFGVLFE